VRMRVAEQWEWEWPKNFSILKFFVQPLGPQSWQTP
jgi:hypothetical protein